MRKTAVVLSLALAQAALLPAQDPAVQAIIEAVRIDSVMACLEKLTGEVPVDIGNGPETITSRHQWQPGNVLAQRWLAMELERMGYEPVLDTFSTTGINVLAARTGTVHPEQAVVFCAHYDSAPAAPLGAPGADDNGSGCGAVWEAARLFQGIDFEHTVLFAFWDNEEQGLLGSKHYAQNAAGNDVPLRGVVNMDAIAYDGNADTKARIHTRPIANSHELSDTLFAVRAHYGIDLDLILTDPGAAYSDHASFWNNGYGAILVIEEFGADGNPYYHTPNDRIEHFDVPYYEKMIKLSIATAATLAVPVAGQSVQGPVAAAVPALEVRPNPAMEAASVRFAPVAPGRYRLEMFNALGVAVGVVHDGPLAAGPHRFELPLAGRPAGAYFVRAMGDAMTPITVRMVRAAP
ncbi:MAG: M28 family metallopeptidase [Flavobacteriales bacterium]|jgi:hypothetical protein|nr:M28 family metallopeptidase [Flavobacteriales bacterium]